MKSLSTDDEPLTGAGESLHKFCNDNIWKASSADNRAVGQLKKVRDYALEHMGLRYNNYKFEIFQKKTKKAIL